MAPTRWMCPHCAEWSVLQVAEDPITRKVFYSCYSEECEWYAELLVRLEGGPFMAQKELVNQLLKVVKDSE